MERTPDMSCLICLENKATKTNSHFVPVGFTKSLFGNRNAEEIYTIDPFADDLIDKYYGRENLRGISEVQVEEIIKQNPFTRDYIFCPRCEEGLAVFEERIIKELNPKIFDEKYKNNFLDVENEFALIDRTLNKVDSFEFDTFFISIIWRMNLHFKLDNRGEDAFQNTEMIEYLRKQLFEAIINKKKPNDDWLKSINYQVIISDKIDLETESGNQVIPIISHQDPYVLMVDKYLINFRYNSEKFDSIKDFFGISLWKISHNSLNNNNKSDRSITLVELEQWQKFIQFIIDRQAIETIEKYSRELGEKLKISQEEAAQILHNRAKDLERQANNTKEFGLFYNASFQQLMK